MNGDEKRHHQTEDHPNRRNCDKDCHRVDKLERWQHDFQKPDGLLGRIYTAIGTKVSSAVFFWITGFVIMFLAGSYGYTTAFGGKLASKESVEVVAEKVEKIEERIDKNQRAIMSGLDALRRGE